MNDLDYSDRINIIAPIVAFVLFLIGLVWLFRGGKPDGK